MLRQLVLAIFADEASADGGEAETHELDDGALAEVDAASIAVPAVASVNTTA